MRLWRHFGELSSIRRHSVRRQFALIFTGLMASTILLCWFMNNMFLEQYYVSNKTDILFDAYHTISQAANRDTYSTEAFWRELNNVCGVYNITVCVMDANTDTRYVSTNGGAELRVRLIAYLFGFVFFEHLPNKGVQRFQFIVSQGIALQSAVLAPAEAVRVLRDLPEIA